MGQVNRHFLFCAALSFTLTVGITNVYGQTSEQEACSELGPKEENPNCNKVVANSNWVQSWGTDEKAFRCAVERCSGCEKIPFLSLYKQCIAKQCRKNEICNQNHSCKSGQKPGKGLPGDDKPKKRRAKINERLNIAKKCLKQRHAVEDVFIKARKKLEKIVNAKASSKPKRLECSVSCTCGTSPASEKHGKTCPDSSTYDRNSNETAAKQLVFFIPATSTTVQRQKRARAQCNNARGMKNMCRGSTCAWADSTFECVDAPGDDTDKQKEQAQKLLGCIDEGMQSHEQAFEQAENAIETCKQKLEASK